MVLDQLRWLEKNRAQIIALGALAESQRRLSPELVKMMTDARLFAILLPKRLGGLELPILDALDVIEAVSAIDGAVGWCLLKGATSNQLAAYFPAEGAREIWTDPLIVTGGSFNPKGKAVRTPDGYRLTGRWDWGTGTTHSAWIMAGAIVVDPQNSEAMRGPHGGPVVKTLFVRASDVDFIDTWHTHGMRGTGSVDFATHDVFVPDHLTIDGPLSLPVLDTEHSAVPLAAQMMVPHAALAIGIAKGALASLIDLARGKTPLMATSKLAEDKLTQDGVGQAAALIDSSRAYMRHCVESAWAQGATPVTYPALSLASVHATHACVAATDILYKLAGGSAVSASSPLARAWHDIHVAASHFLVNRDKFATSGKTLLQLPQ